MKYLELSEKNVRDESLKLAKKIEKEFIPEIVIFVAKGSFYIGDEISKYFNVPLIEIKAVREKNKLKELLSPILKLIPRKIKQILREMEINSNTHKKVSKRNVEMEERYLKELLKYKKVLLVDDSIDTGNTIVEILNYLKKDDLKIKTAGLNVFDMSKETIKIDFYNYENTLLNGPWSKDSKYYVKFMEDYREWRA
ncbi:MAG: phosphoribosyltransferase [Fusobacterium sp.]